MNKSLGRESAPPPAAARQPPGEGRRHLGAARRFLRRALAAAALRALAFACSAALGTLPAWAQYKVVGPDGKITYTDRPPPSADGKALPLARGQDTGAADIGLPYALRTIAGRYPVTLYTTADCEPCDRGRQLLRQRGVPHRERTATTDADRAAWARNVGGTQAPVLTIGSQTLSGLNESTWNSYLDAAGYPKESQLPASYTPPPPQPLVAEAPAAEAPAAAPAPAPAPAAPPASGGFRF